MDERERQIQHVREVRAREKLQQQELEWLVRRRAWQELSPDPQVAEWRERQALTLAGCGLSTSEIGRRIGISGEQVRKVLRKARLARAGAWLWPREHGEVARAWRVANGLPAALYLSGNEQRRANRAAKPWPWPTGRPDSWLSGRSQLASAHRQPER
jgi:hypothetical protein